MSESRLLLCTDMDRTVIPNGVEPEHLEARMRFRKFCQLPEVTLVYITGRHRQLVEKAIRSYQLPEPDYLVTDVGSKVYQFQQQQWQEMSQWQQEIAKDWSGKSHQQLKLALQDIEGLKLQEFSKQNTHKLSFYLPVYHDNQSVMATMQQRLDELGVKATVMWSIDELTNIGLLDVLPARATKLHALEFLQQHLQFAAEQVVFAGDSGNDLPVLVSEFQSVLVHNASNEIKQLAVLLSQDNGHPSQLLLATDPDPLGMNGNYSAGVLQGVWHFMPEFRDRLQTGVHS
ncbi:alpha,alpha-trehalose-phosphate synthase [Methylophaga lonarensis MPL]|uniref:Alpha,alpha-trehalose-phosphate synthase n=1 Tax=Methylophaga lonarensis MPL TaxID=1286106 RepID=M7P1R4_9GAMM|nr:HAD-IIB family hydrolase [Methylophaga lonarensis]EMR13402.1 alpha,alpha-trehalose-phosphate synthase [Methylophaga lonarensis MPL]